MQDIPEDILYEVFEHAVKLDPTTHPLSISHCCRLWREMALATPTLWTQIIIHQGQNGYLGRLFAWLERSRRKLLDIHIHRSKTNDRMYDSRGSYLDECFRVLLKHRSRWRTLALEAYPLRRLERRLLSDSVLPELTKLSLGMDADQASSFVWGILGCTAPKLQELDLAGVVAMYHIDMWMPSRIQHRITSLTIRFGDRPMSHYTFMSILRRCSTLERLTLELPIRPILSQADFLANPISAVFIEVPNLRSLALNPTSIGMERLPFTINFNAPNLNYLGCSIPFESILHICSLPTFPFPSLENLSLVANDYYIIPYSVLESEVLVQFLSRLPKLRRLELSDVDFDASSDIPFPFMSALTTICPLLDGLSTRSSWGVHMIEWLQSLVIARQQDTNRIRPIKELVIDCSFYQPTVEQKAWLVTNVEKVRFDNE